jgi:hypothetical protein
MQKSPLWKSFNNLTIPGHLIRQEFQFYETARLYTNGFVEINCQYAINLLGASVMRNRLNDFKHALPPCGG